MQTDTNTRNYDIKTCCCILQELQKVDNYATSILVDSEIVDVSITNDNFEYKYGIFTTKNTSYIAFRGSKTNNDYITDITASKHYPWSCYEGSIHKGFYDLSEKISIQSIIDKLSYKRIVLCGYSLGGAIAQLVGIRMMCKKTDIINNLTIYTFGSPLVGNKEFSSYCKKRFLKNFMFVVNYNDIVPKILTRLGYEGFGKHVVINTNGEISICEYDNLYTKEYKKTNINARLGIQSHMKDLYCVYLYPYCGMPTPNPTQYMDSCERGVPIIRSIRNISSIYLGKFKIEIKGSYLDSIKNIKCHTLLIKGHDTIDSETKILVCMTQGTQAYNVKKLSFSYKSIFGNSLENNVTLNAYFPKIINAKQEEKMSKENLRNIIQNAIFSSKYSIIDSDKAIYNNLLQALEKITYKEKIKFTEKAARIMQNPVISSVDDDCIAFVDSIFNKYGEIKDDKLYSILETNIDTAERDVIFHILLSRAYKKYKDTKNCELEKIHNNNSTNQIQKDAINIILKCKSKNDTIEHLHIGGIGQNQEDFIVALEQCNIVKIYAATTKSKIRIMEYVALTQPKDFLENPALYSWIKTGISMVLVGSAILLTPIGGFFVIPFAMIIMLHYCYSYRNVAQAGTWVYTMLARNVGLAEYLEKIEMNYVNNLKMLSIILGNQVLDDDNTWKLEKYICEKLENFGIEKYSDITPDIISCKELKINKSKNTQFTNYVTVVYIIHMLRIQEMGIFNVAVIGTTKVGKSKLLRHFGFDTGSSAVRNTKTIASYPINTRCRIIDFPGCDDTNPTVRAQFETNVQLANMFVIVLDAEKLNTTNEYSFVVNTVLRKKKTPIIILCNKADRLLEKDEDEDECTEDDFRQKIKPIENFVKNSNRNDVKVYVCCLKNDVNDKDFIRFGIKRGNDVKSCICDMLSAEGVDCTVESAFTNNSCDNYAT